MFGIDDAAIAIVGSSVVSGLLGSNSSKDAARAQKDAAEASIQMQREHFDATRNDLAPYRDAGVPALQRLAFLTGTGGDASQPGYGSLTKNFSLQDFAADPGYGFRQQQGEQSLNRAMTARGLSSSTTGLKSLMSFNQDLASQEYGAAYGRYRDQQSNQFNMLSYLAGTGQNASAMTGQVGANMSAGMSGTMLAGGAATAGGIMGSGSAINNSIQGGLGNYMYQKRFEDMMQRMPVFSSPANGPSYKVPAGGDYPG